MYIERNPKGGGRKPLSAEDKKIRICTVFGTQKQDSQVRILASKAGKSPAEWLLSEALKDKK